MIRSYLIRSYLRGRLKSWQLQGGESLPFGWSLNASYLALFKRSLTGFCILFFIGCARSPIKEPFEAMRPVIKPPHVTDDLHLKNILSPLRANIERLKTVSVTKLQFGPTIISKEDYILALESLHQSLESNPCGVHFYNSIQSNFQFYEVYGKKKWGEVFMTSYYEPILEGSRKKTKRFSQPLYGQPEDMVLLRMDEFAKIFPKAVLVSVGGPRDYIWTGRLVKKENGFSEVVPFEDRKSIEKSLLKAPVLAWVDPIDSFFLQIQGSGTVRFEDDTEKPVGYRAQNGHPYVPVGKYLLDVIPLEEMSLQAIKKYLRTLPDKGAQEILNKNPSYVFFEERTQGAMGSFGVEVAPGRTIATDSRFFPKGALAFLDFEKPIFKTPESVQPQTWERGSRFVFDQDTGGAIRGPHRLDLFWGKGPVAGRAAGVIRNWGRLYYLVPKPEFLERLKKTAR